MIPWVINLEKGIISPKKGISLRMERMDVFMFKHGDYFFFFSKIKYGTQKNCLDRNGF